MKEIRIKNKGLKKLLEIFDPQDKIVIQELGDTLYGKEGFVDESFFRNIKTVGDILKIDYDFEGLIVFEAEVENVKIHYDRVGEQFVIIGEDKFVEKKDLYGTI